MKGKLIIISAPSGCGKTTIVERLLERNKDWKRSISYTTRPPRSGEANGHDYFFISEDEFKSKERSGFFLESAKVFGHFYGTSKEFVMNEVSQGNYIVLAIDVQGMKQLRNKLARAIPAVSIFIMPPSLESLKARLEKRKTESGKEIEKRLEIAKREMTERSLYDHMVENRQIDQAVKEIEEIVK